MSQEIWTVVGRFDSMTEGTYFPLKPGNHPGYTEEEARDVVEQHEPVEEGSPTVVAMAMSQFVGLFNDGKIVSSRGLSSPCEPRSSL